MTKQTLIAPEEVKKKLLNLVSKNWEIFNRTYAISDKRAHLDHPYSKEIIALLKENFPNFNKDNDKGILLCGYFAWKSYIKNVLTIKHK